MRVKICGITNAGDARNAVACGADALGLIFADSPRKVTPDAARDILRAVSLKPEAAVGVFVDEDPDRILRAAEHCAFGTVQLHGDEGAADIRRLQKHGLRVMKALRVGEGDDLKRAGDIPADALLFDTAAQGRFGGTGRAFDWNVLKGRTFGKPWFVSGGLNPQNVGELLSVLEPDGVDVSGGVERSPGKKDPEKVKEFIRNVKSAR